MCWNFSLKSLFLFLAIITLSLIEVNIADRFDQKLGEIMGMHMVWPFIFAANWLVLLGICHVTKSVFKGIKRTFDGL